MCSTLCKQSRVLLSSEQKVSFLEFASQRSAERECLHVLEWLTGMLIILCLLYFQIQSLSYLADKFCCLRSTRLMTLKNFQAISHSNNSVDFGITSFNFDLLCTRCGTITSFFNIKLRVIKGSCACLLIDETINVLCMWNTLRPLFTSNWLPCFYELQNRLIVERMIEKN